MLRMNSVRRPLLAASASAAALLAMGTTVGSTATAAPIAANGHAEVINNEVRYTGLAGANLVTVAQSGARLLIKDIAPITVGTGCFDSGTDGHFFVVSCIPPVATNGQLRPFRINAGAGNDVVTNTSAIMMRADGSTGDDRLVGGSATDVLADAFGKDVLVGNGGSDVLGTVLSQADGLPDTLDGGAGDDDLQSGPNNDTLNGGSGADTLKGGGGGDVLDGGTGSGDAVSYLDQAHNNIRVVVSLDGQANDGIFTIGTGSAEKDNVLDSNEIVFGGNGNDSISGDERANHLVGNVGDDTLVGGLGADVLDGQSGNDTIAGNQLFSVPVADGAIDTLNGNTGTADYCRVPFAEADITIGCETIDQD